MSPLSNDCSPMTKPISIIVPTYQGYHWLKATLPAIREQDYAGETTIIAIDSTSTDGSVDLLRTYGTRITQIPQAQFTHGYARNLGVQIATTDLIIFMSQDALPIGKSWLSKLVTLLDDPRIGAAHIRQIARPEATPLEQFFQLEMYPPQSKEFCWDGSAPLYLKDIFFSNVCSITRRELLLKYPFEEDLIMSEDQVFAKNLLKAGFITLYSSDAAVLHSHNYRLGALFRRNFDSAYSLLGVTDDTLRTNFGDGLLFIDREIKYMVQNRHWSTLAYIPIYEAARILGRLFGAKANSLPQWLRLRMSLHKSYWLRKDRG
jgi:rhamnosyltransferase